MKIEQLTERLRVMQVPEFGMKRITVGINPRKNEIKKLLNDTKHKELRAIITMKECFMVDAEHLIHADIAYMMGVDQNTYYHLIIVEHNASDNDTFTRIAGDSETGYDIYCYDKDIDRVINNPWIRIQPDQYL